MPSFLLSEAAENDIRDIWFYIAFNSITSADDLENKIYTTCQFLAENPLAGKKRPEIITRPVRFFNVRGIYWIIYEADTNPITINRVIHSARDILKLL